MANTTNPILPGTVKSAAPALNGFDSDGFISAELASRFKYNGYAFCARYLSLGQGQNPGDLSNAEATGILNAGLALIPVQHVISESWTPNEELGVEYGSNAAANAASIGLPKGMNLWCDLEGVSEGTNEQSVINYCTAWYTAVFNAGYIPGLYVGAACGLMGEQLYNLPFQHYWKSASNVPSVEPRGYQLIQGEETTVLGLGIDPDTTQYDAEGGAVLWLSC
jgi:hypothetical protein